MGARFEGGVSNRTFKEVVLVAVVPKKEIAKCFKKIKMELKNVFKEEMESKEHSVTSFSKKYARYLNLPNKWVKIISDVANASISDVKCGNENEELIKKNMDITWEGRSWTSIAATIVYIVTRLPKCPKRVDMKMISQCSDVKESTIAACYK